MANVNDVRRASEQVDKQLSMLDEALDVGWLHSDDHEAILASWRHYRGSRWSTDLSQRERLRQLRLSATTAKHQAIGPLIDFAGVDDANRLIGYLKDGIGPEKTRRGWSGSKSEEAYVGALRAFFEYLDEHGEGDFPWFDDIPYPESEDRRKDPEEMLDPKDIAAIREHTVDYREAAFVEFLADTGLRVSAACQLRVGDLNLDNQPPTYRLNPNGKSQKGADDHDFSRWDLHYSTMFVREWVNERHPDSHPDAPLWPMRQGYDPDDRVNGAAGPSTLEDLVKEAAERAGVDKPTNLHSFRHACVKRLRKDGFDWDEIGDLLAWSEESVAEMMLVYGRLDADERRDKIRAKRGIEVPGDEAEAEPQECPFCGFENRPEWSVCQNCHTDLDRVAARREDTEAMADQLEAGGVDPSFVAQFQRLRESHPELFAPVETGD